MYKYNLKGKCYMNVIRGLIKIICAGVVAVAILSVIMCFYYLMPLHHENKNGNTDYIWTPNSIWLKCTEGISWGRFDSAGYNNPEVISNPDIIILGSSHVESLNVLYKDSLCGQLSDLIEDRYSIYNMGISGHNFYKVCQYLPDNLDMYDVPPKIVIIEVDNLALNEENVMKVFNHEVKHTPSNDTGFIAMMQRVPFFRCLYLQIDSGLLNLFLPSITIENYNNDGNLSLQKKNIDEVAYDKLFKYLSELESEYGTQIIIFNHPTGQVNADGNISFSDDDALILFNQYAEKYDIDFIDMTSSFEDMYYNNHQLSHGFVTGRIGEGHLNANGHAAIAKELYYQIIKMEKAGLLCR